MIIFLLSPKSFPKKYFLEKIPCFGLSIQSTVVNLQSQIGSTDFLSIANKNQT